MRLWLLITGLCFWNLSLLSSQVITTDPAFPSESDEVTIIFDASQGAGGLENCNCDVYLHTGVITGQSAGNSEWRYVHTTWGEVNPAWKLTPVDGQPNKFSYLISPSIREYYQVAQWEEIRKMAFVFRNADGSKEGKGTGNTDILVEVSDESLQLSLTSPAQQVILVDLGEEIMVSAETNLPAQISIFRDGNLISEVMDATEISELFTADANPHTLTVTALAGEATVSKSIVYLVPAELESRPAPDDYSDGLTEIDGTTALFQLHAPTNEVAFLIGDFNNWQPHTDNLMHRTEDGTFWIQVNNLIPGQTYAYQYLADEGIRIADPLSTLVLDPNNDPFIPEVTFPNMPAYPSDITEGIVSVFDWGKPGYNWIANDFQPPQKDKLVIYELLLRDFLDRHDYSTLLDTLGYLERLGINAIELMPVSEFEGNQSWGYNPSFHMALDKFYGSPDAFKSLIDECHRRGIAVILDVVYNHAFSQSALAQLDWDAANFRPGPTNPWLNVEATHPFNVGYDFNHESPSTRRYIDRVMKYWLEEFRIDGFRFDLAKGFTQRQTSDVGTWSSYDANRIGVLKHYADVMWSVNPQAYVILEHFAENPEEIELNNYGMMSWAGSGVHNQYLEAAMGYTSDLNGAAYTSWNWPYPGLVAYMESHDEERMVYKNIRYGNSSGSYNVKNYPTFLQRAELAAAFFYTVPGPKMLWQFGELGYDFSINTCEDGSVTDNCRLSPKPVRWDYLQNPGRKRLFDVVSGLIHLKKKYEVFNTGEFLMDVGSNSVAKKIFLNGPDIDAVVQGNFGVTNQSLPDPFPETGWWYDYFSGDSILIENANLSVDLAPGEYHIYTSVQVNEPPNGFVTAATKLVKDFFRLKIAPNPANGPLRIQYYLDKGNRIRLELLNTRGQLVTKIFEGIRPTGEHSCDFEPELPSGMYLLQLLANGRKEVVPVIID